MRDGQDAESLYIKLRNPGGIGGILIHKGLDVPCRNAYNKTDVLWKEVYDCTDLTFLIDGSGSKKDLSRRMNSERHVEESKEEDNYE